MVSLSMLLCNLFSQAEQSAAISSNAIMPPLQSKPRRERMPMPPASCAASSSAVASTNAPARTSCVEMPSVPRRRT
jgi:hypothetical protein